MTRPEPKPPPRWHRPGTKVRVSGEKGWGEITYLDRRDHGGTPYLVTFNFHSVWAAEGDILEVRHDKT